MSTVTLAEVKAHLQMTTTANDTELQRFIDAAEAAMTHEVGALVATATTEKHDGGSTCIVVRQPRALSLTSIAYADGTASTLADYDLDTDTGIIYWDYGTRGYFPGGARNVTVVYQSGFTALPADLSHAVKELVRHLWETQRPNSASRPGFAVHRGVGVSDEPVAVGAFSSWPLRVQELIRPYQRTDGLA